MVMADAKVFLAYNMRCPFHHRAPRLSTPSPTTRRPNTRSLSATRSDRPATARAVHSTITPHPCPPWTPLSFPPALSQVHPPAIECPCHRAPHLSLSLSPHIPPSPSFRLHVSTRVFAFGTFTRAPPKAPPAARRTTSSRRRVGCRCSPADAFGRCKGSSE